MGRNLKLKHRESDFEFTKNHKRLLLGSVFLMATSAIGPAFLTQTAVFTSQFLASFAFAILLSIIIDIGAQINIWRILVVTGLRGQEISNKVVPGLGIVMILVVAYVMFVSNPPYGDAFVHTFAPEHPMKLVLPIITLVGGTVGGYITFAGAHRILDSGIKGKQYLPFVNQSAIAGILTTGIMRTLLFLAVLGVVVTGVTLSSENPPASVFEHAIGPIGKNIFGIVLFAAAMSSVIGAAYTSATFLKTLHKSLDERSNLIVIVFIVISTMIFLFIGKPISLLIIAGAINGWILPITLGAILIASKKKSIVGDYKHPNWMFIFGIVAVLVTILTGIFSFKEVLQLF